MFTGLKKTIGTPLEIDKNFTDPTGFERPLDLTIPQKETNELAPKEEVKAFEDSATEVSAKSSAVKEAVRQCISEVLGDVNAEHYTPIKMLTTFNFDWRIKARVTKKHALKNWKNDKTSGKLLNIELMDA